MTASGRPAAAPKGASHVLMTADAVGGVWTYALDLARGYAERGVRTTLAVFGPSAPGAMAAATPGLALVDMRRPLDWTAAGPAELREAARDLAALCTALAPDVVHLNAPALGIGGDLKAPVVGACHSCLETWWRAVRSGEPPQDFAWRIALLREALRACSLLIAPSAAFARATAEAHRVRTPLVVHNGRPPRRTDPAGSPGAFAFTAGRLWDEGKNAAVLDAAAAEAGLRAVAAGPLQGPLGQSIALPHVEAPGALAADGIAAWLSLRPVFVSPALYEPFGLSVLEAAQAGCPLVLSDIATFRELWEGAALFFDPRDASALAVLLRRLAEEPALAHEFGERARRRSRAYGAEAMIEGTLAAYARVAPGFRPAEAAA